MELIGMCDVDSGLLMIGDPCYHVENDCWHDWLDKNHILTARESVLRHKGGHAGAGVVAGTAHGDGSYPVYRVGQGSYVVVTDDSISRDLRLLADHLDAQMAEQD